MSTKDKDVTDFQLIENAIHVSMAKLCDKLTDGGDLLLFIAVLSKLAAEAAIECGMSEADYVHRMRSVYQVLEGKQLYKGD